MDTSRVTLVKQLIWWAEAVYKCCRSMAWYGIFMGSPVACHAGCSRVRVHYVEDAPAFVRKAQGRMEILDHCRLFVWAAGVARFWLDVERWRDSLA